MIIAGKLLKKAVMSGLLLHDIAQIVCREDLDTPSPLENICTQASESTGGAQYPGIRSNVIDEPSKCDHDLKSGISIDIDLITSNRNAPSSATSPPGFWASQAPWTNGSSPTRHSKDLSWDTIFSDALHRAATGETDKGVERPHLVANHSSRAFCSENEATFFAALDRLLGDEIEKRLFHSRCFK